MFTFSADIIHFGYFNWTSSTSVLPECNFGVAPYSKSPDNMTESGGLWDTLLILLVLQGFTLQYLDIK